MFIICLSSERILASLDENLNSYIRGRYPLSAFGAIRDSFLQDLIEQIQDAMRQRHFDIQSYLTLQSTSNALNLSPNMQLEKIRILRLTILVDNLLQCYQEHFLRAKGFFKVPRELWFSEGDEFLTRNNALIRTCETIRATLNELVVDFRERTMQASIAS